MTAAEPTTDRTPWRVLVTGFLDWPANRDAAAGFDRWRCLENPSGRLFIGRWHEGGSPPAPDSGELPRRLAIITTTADGRSIKWRFAVLPVLWRIGETLDTTDVDAVVNIGLGVYDAADRILVESGATNRRSAQCDAAGTLPGEREDVPGIIDAASADVVCATPDIAGRLGSAPRAVAGTRYRVEVATARVTNAFVCNETHALMLRRVVTGSRLRRAAFIHIPKPAAEKDYDELARVLAALTVHLVMP